MSDTTAAWTDPVVEAYKRDVDRTLLRENLKLTPEERLLKLQDFMRFLSEVPSPEPSSRRRESSIKGRAMPFPTEQVELRTNDESIALRMTGIEKFADGSGYRCDLTVRSGGLSCHRPFFFDDSSLPHAVESLRRMDQGNPGEAVIKGAWDADFIRFAMNDKGHVFVTGEIFEYSELPQSLKFAFRTDQTLLGPLICDLQLLLDA